MTDHDLTSGTIIVAYDGSPDAERALDWAAVQAGREGRHLDLVHVLGADQTQAAVWATASGVSLVALQETVRATARALIEAAVDRVRAEHPGLDARGHVLEGDARHALLDMSSSAHLLVLGSRGRRAVASLLLGSVSATVAGHAECPVVVTRPRATESGSSDAGAGIVVGADATVDSLPVIEYAFRQASLCSAPLTVVHCYRDVVAYPGVALSAPWAEVEELRTVLSQSIAGMSEKFPDVEVTCRLERGLTDQVLTSDLHDWDLIVVGRHHKNVVDRILVGSVARTVLEHARTAVAVVPEADTQDKR